MESIPINYPELIVEKSYGTTKSEQKLVSLGYNTFLRLWSYPNPYKMQDNGKELCDLLVVFENHIIIFSDKDCLYGHSGNPEIDWKRWYKKTILKSAEQLVGAKTWITNCPDRIAIDAKCTKKFPFKIDITPNTEFHLIAVAHGATERCKEYFSGGDGGLCINNQIAGDDHTKANCYPFHIGSVFPEDKNFVHVFDDSSYTNILQELDTIQDFIDYLKARKELLLTKAVFAESENNILAQHLRGVIIGNNQSLKLLFKNCDTVILTGQMIEDVKQSKEYIEWKEKTRGSYFWDWLLQKTFSFIENGTTLFATPSTIQDQSLLFERLARENRAHRCVLANGFLSFFASVNQHERGTRIICLKDNPDTCYLLFLLPRESYMNDDTYRLQRREMLMSYCKIVKIDYPFFKYIIGVAHESGMREYSSEDFIFLDTAEWSYEQQMEAEMIKKEYQRMGILGVRTERETHISFDNS